jgi:hypothetical protein
MSATSVCPGERTLRGFRAGRLDAGQTRSIREHLATCPSCLTALESLAPTPPHDPPPDGSIRTLMANDLSATGMMPTGSCGVSIVDPIAAQTFAAPPGYLPPSDFWLPGTNPHALGRIGPYEVINLVGRGGMGSVYKGFDKSLQRAVAIKLLAGDLASDPRARRQFLRGARAAAAISHPNVVTIHAVSQQRGVPFLVMEYLGGPTLLQRIRAQGRLHPTEILGVGAQLAAGLAAAHARGVIHRDINPANIMLEEGCDRVKITDFGLAQGVLDLAHLAALGHMAGTPSFMAPEQVRCGAIGPHSDLFSLGCVLYAMAAGRSPFAAASTPEVTRKVCEETPIPLHELDPAVPPHLSEIVARLLRKDPRDRFPSAEALEQALRSHPPVSSRRPGDGSASPARPHGRRLGRRAAAGIAGVGLLALVALMATVPRWRPSHPVITVGRSGDAQARTLAEALGRATPGAIIRVIDGGTYREVLRIDDPSRQRDVTIDGQGRCILAARDPAHPVLTVLGTPGVTLRDVRIRAPGQAEGIVIAGEAAGVTLDGVDAVQPPDATKPILLICAGAQGTADRPICVRNSTLSCAAEGLCVWVLGHPDAPIDSVRLEHNQFRGPGVHLLLWGSIGDVTVAENLFWGGKNGVNLNFEETSQCRSLKIANNTFLGTTYWLGLVRTVARQDRVVVCNNLILGADAVEEGSAGQLAAVAGRWTFTRNWWELEPGAPPLAPGLGRIAHQEPSLALISRDPKHPDFLRPRPDSPLATGGVGGALARHIGAMPPVIAPGR